MDDRPCAADAVGEVAAPGTLHLSPDGQRPGLTHGAACRFDPHQELVFGPWLCVCTLPSHLIHQNRPASPPNVVSSAVPLPRNLSLAEALDARLNKPLRAVPGHGIASGTDSVYSTLGTLIVLDATHALCNPFFVFY
jgi:hypothetical protein